MARNVEFNEKEAIQKAMEVFWEKGYNGTSLRDLTDAMKINSSSLYNTIGDKKELFVKCIELYTEAREKDLIQREKSKGKALSILTKYIEDSVKIVIIEKNGCFAIKTVFEGATDDPRIKNLIKNDNDNNYQFISRTIAKAMAEGDISNEESPELLADFFISVWTGWYESYLIHRDPLKIKKMAQYFIKQITK